MTKQKNDLQKGKTGWQYAVEISAIVGCLGTLFFGYFAIKGDRDAIQDARSIAAESGNFDKPKLRLALGNTFLDPGLPNRVFIGIPVEKRDASNFGKIPFTLTNQGKKTANKVLISDGLPKSTRLGFKDLLVGKFDSFHPSKTNDAQLEIKEAGDFTYCLYAFPFLNPEQAMVWQSPLFFYETQPDSLISQEISISGEDLEMYEYKLKIQIVFVENEQELIEKSIVLSYNELNEKRKALTFPDSRLTKLEDKIFIGFADIEPAELKEGMFVKPEFTIAPNRFSVLVINDSDEGFVWLGMCVFGFIFISGTFLIVMRFMQKRRKTKTASA